MLEEVLHSCRFGTAKRQKRFIPRNLTELSADNQLSHIHPCLQRPDPARSIPTDTTNAPTKLRGSWERMATETMTMAMPGKNRLPKDHNLPPENERFMRACSDIANALIQEHEAQQDPDAPKKDINLNSLRSKMSKKHRLSNIPPLTAIIAAIPEHYKKYILPKLIAKPISEYWQVYVE